MVMSTRATFILAILCLLLTHEVLAVEAEEKKIGKRLLFQLQLVIIHDVVDWPFIVFPIYLTTKKRHKLFGNNLGFVNGQFCS